jgi:hypothetical protein
MNRFSDPYVGIHERHMRVFRFGTGKANGVNRSQMQLLET